MTQILPIASPPTEAIDVFADTLQRCRILRNKIGYALNAMDELPAHMIHWGHVGTVSALCELLRQAQEVCDGLSNPNE